MSDKNIFLVTLLSCSALVYPVVAQAETLSAKTSWAVSRVASTSQGSYCTMAQKYSDDTVLTFARNTAEEYSLAIDFKEGQFKPAEKQNVTLSSQGGTSQKFDVKPKSERTMVINIGKDNSLLNQIAKTGNLSVELGGKVIQFSMNEFKAGQAEMEGCMNGLKSASTNINKLTEAELVKRQVAVVRTPEIDNAQPTAEGLLAAMPMPSADISPAITPQEEAEFIKVDEPAIKVANTAPQETKDTQEIFSLREENARLTRSISEQRQAFENQKSSKETALLSELREKLNMAQSENQTLKTQLTDQKSLVSQSDTLANQSQRSQQELAALKAENETLKNQIKIASSTKTNSAPVPDDEIIKVRNELRQITSQLDVLKTENVALKEQVTVFQKGNENSQLKSAGGNWDLEQSTRRYQESQREIVRLGALLQTKDAKCTQEKKDIEYMLFDPAIADKAQIAMLNSLEDQVKEKDEKLKSIETQADAVEKKAISEKDIEINQLKKTVIQTKLDHSEKLKQVNQSQDEALASLRIELEQKNKQIASSQAEAQNAKLSETALVTKQQSIDSLKAELAQMSQQLADAQKKAQGLESLNSSLATKDSEVNSLKAELAQKNLQLGEVQKKAQQVSLKAENDKNAEQALAMGQLQLQIQQANQQILILQKQIADSKNITVQASYVAPVVTSPEPRDFSKDFKSMDDVSSLLKKAGIEIRGALQNVQGGDPSTYRAYSWKTGSLFGSAEMKKVSDASQFRLTVDQYLDRAKTRCKGEFAAIPSVAQSNNSKAYEIACVGESSSSSASVMFNYGDKIVTTIAHEGRAEAMDLAIDARDKIASQF